MGILHNVRLLMWSDWGMCSFIRNLSTHAATSPTPLRDLSYDVCVGAYSVHQMYGGRECEYGIRRYGRGISVPVQTHTGTLSARVTEMHVMLYLTV